MAVLLVRSCGNYCRTKLVTTLLYQKLKTTCNSVAFYKSKQSLENLYLNSKQDSYTLPASNKDLSNNEEFSGFIPIDQLNIQYSKSSGPGGQHVNKVNTKVEIRFHVESAEWIPSWIKSKLVENEKGRMTKYGFLVVKSELTRKQLLNQADCMGKLRTMIFNACFQPGEPTNEELQTRAQKIANAQRLRLKTKREHSLKKQLRQTPEVGSI